jgi:putative NIF3 family GTP cyclohydrolase 1 type 2
LTPLPDTEEEIGAGRWGKLDPPGTVRQVASRLKAFLGIERLQLVGNPEKSVSAVAVACGSAGKFLEDARRAGCDLFITGETDFHTCLEAEAGGVALLLTGHFASERFAVERLADVLAAEFPHVEVWPSRDEKDPLRVI